LDQLIVVLPGIGGSVLATSAAPDADVVWDAGKRSVGRLVFRSEALDLDRPLTPVGWTRSTKFLGFTLVPGYEELQKTLEGLGKFDPGHPGKPVPDADVVVVPYDFRCSILDAAERLDAVVSARLSHLSEAERAGRVVVLAHSLGGLVARTWLAGVGQSKVERWRWCRALVTLGTPHRGAPKALDWVVNGAPLRLPGPSRLVREWPSVAELLPRYPVIRDTRIADQEAEGACLYPHDLHLPGLGDRAREAFRLHEEIRKAWDTIPRSALEMKACIGWPHPTPDASYWNGVRLRVEKHPPPWLPAAGWEKDTGDGTVPGIAGVPIEQDNEVDGPRRVRARHVPLASSDVVAELLGKYLTMQPPSKYRDPRPDRHPPSLGLELDEVHEGGVPIPVLVTPREIDPDLGGRPVSARLTAEAGTVTAIRLDPVPGAFRGEFPSQPPGLYEVRVTAREVRAAGDLTTSDTIAVVDEGATGG
jgi:hypothetical protein